jgi:DNA-binding SARP family transcriptional activator
VPRHLPLVADTEPGKAGLTLTGEFELILSGRRLAIPHSAERVLAYLALANRPVARSHLAGALWLDSSDQRAASSLRTVLWRLHRAGANVVFGGEDRLGLRGVVVDLNLLLDLARRLIRHPDPDDLARLTLLIGCGDVLPAWDEEWVVADRERFRLMRLEALERAASALIVERRLGEAVIVAVAAVRSDPLRESARRVLMEAYFSQGNVGDAIRCYRSFCALLQAEFGVRPTSAMDDLLRSWCGGPGVTQL